MIKISQLALTRYLVDHELRRYHNVDHAHSVMSKCFDIDPECRQVVILAALYHDAVYIPGAGEDANERCSAAAFEIDAIKSGMFERGDPLVEYVKQLILGTTVKNHLSSNRIVGNLAILLDADLSSLAADYSEFTFNQECIIIEQGGEVNSHNMKKCGEFLKQFLLVRDYIYHTQKARELWETKARDNIYRLLKI